MNDPSTQLDLGAASRRLSGLIAGVPETSLDASTPCPEYCLGDLLDHIGRLADEFTRAAEKSNRASEPPARPPDVARLPTDWRTRIPERLVALADAWQTPTAWTGTTRAGGAELPSETAGLAALSELVLHGWDVAASTGQHYDADEPTLKAVERFVGTFANDTRRGDGPFGAPLDAADDATPLERLLALSGRDPRWRPSPQARGRI